MYQRILLPTDGSDATEKAIEEAVGLAVVFDADLHVLSVADTSGFQSPGPTGSAVDQLEEDARAAVESAAVRAREAGVDRVETAVEPGNPAERIRETADAIDADLIVMGTHGRSGLSRHLVGSVAEKTVRTADAPVLTVSGPDVSGEGSGPASGRTQSGDGEERSSSGSRNPASSGDGTEDADG